MISVGIDKLTAEEERFFTRLLVVVDDYGRIDARLELLRSKCFPLKPSITAAQVGGWLDGLDRAGLVVHFGADSRTFLEIAGWAKHQRPPRAKESKCPSPHAKGSIRCHLTANAPVIRDSGFGIRDSGFDVQLAAAAGSEPPPPKARRRPSGQHQAFVDWWCTRFEEVLGVRYTVDGGKDGAAASWILKSGVSREEIVRRVDAYLRSNDAFIVQSGRTLARFRAQFVALATAGKTAADDDRELEDITPKAGGQS